MEQYGIMNTEYTTLTQTLPSNTSPVQPTTKNSVQK